MDVLLVSATALLSPGSIKTGYPSKISGPASALTTSTAADSRSADLHRCADPGSGKQRAWQASGVCSPETICPEGGSSRADTLLVAVGEGPWTAKRMRASWQPNIAVRTWAKRFLPTFERPRRAKAFFCQPDPRLAQPQDTFKQDAFQLLRCRLAALVPSQPPSIPRDVEAHAAVAFQAACAARSLRRSACNSGQF